MAIKKYHVSKNLFDINNIIEDYYLKDGVPTEYHIGGYVLSDYIPIASNTATISAKRTVISDSGAHWAIYDENKTFIRGGLAFTARYEPYSKALDTSGASFIRVDYATDSLTDCMLNIGSTALPYEPYGNTWNSIPYRKYGTETDIITSLPAEIIGDGTNATVAVNGQSSQASTPSPSSPVPVSGVGEMSVNLTNVNSFTNSETTDTGRDYFRAQLRLSDSTNTSISIYENGHYKLSIENVGNTTVTFRHSGQTTNILIFNYTATFSTPQTVTVSFDVEGYDPENLNGLVLRNIMLNVGSDELPYAPYGQDVIPVTKNGVTTNYALGTVQSTRQIKKTVLTGQENWAINGEGTDKAYFSYPAGDNIQSSTTQICSHYSYNTVTKSNTNTGIYVTSSGVIRIREENADTSSLTTFTAFLAQQYANDTPVTVWYVLATPTTGIVNEPLMKIGDYADSISVSIPTTDGANTLDISTTLQPSSVDVTYHGWHSHNDTEFTE